MCATEDALKFGTYVESGMGGLVVGYILGSYADAVNRIVQESMETIFSRESRDIKAQGAIIFGAHKNLFAPIAYDIGG